MGCGKSKNKQSETPKGLNVNRDRSEQRETKVVLLGDQFVGKSSIAHRYCNNTFSEAYEVTIGGGYLQQTVRLKDNRTIKLDIWDTGGQERFRSLLPLYYREASSAIITYDITDDKTFSSCEYWVEELKKHFKDDTCVLVLCGNKSDRVEDRKVQQSSAKQFAESHSMLWMETSAKTGDNIGKLFEAVAIEILKRRAATANQ